MSKPKTTTLRDGTKVFCLLKAEAAVLDYHVQGYMAHGIQVKKGDIIFDVGANIGIFGVRAVQQAEDVQVFAFEPIPSIHKVLEANAKKFAPDRFHALPYGVSSEPGSMSFMYYPNSPAFSTSQPELWDDQEELNRAVLGNIRNPPPHMWWMKWLPTFIAKWFAKRMRQGAQKVDAELRTVSQIIEEHQLPKIDLLKIDCEGAEWDVLKGVSEADWPKINKVVAEVYDTDDRLKNIKTLLEKYGLSNITIEKEKGLEETNLYNIYATRS